MNNTLNALRDQRISNPLEIFPNEAQTIALGKLVAKWKIVKVIYQESDTGFIFTGCGQPGINGREFYIYIMVIGDGSTHS